MTVPVVIGLGFLCVPFLKAGAIQFYLSATSVFVLPLAVLYLVGALTTVHRSAGVVGLLTGGLPTVFLHSLPEVFIGLFLFGLATFGGDIFGIYWCRP